YAGALFPSLHQRKEGWLRHQENVAKPPKLTQPGWFSFCSQSENHPDLAISGCFSDIFLIARPPLLAVMQGGECARLQFVHTSHRPRLQDSLATLISFYRPQRGPLSSPSGCCLAARPPRC